MNSSKHVNRSEDATEPRLINRRGAMIGAGSLFVGLSGCLSPGNFEVAGGINEEAFESVFKGTSFEGTDLLVSLVDGHEVSSLNLIGPEGEAYRSISVEEGESTIRIPILRIEPGRFEHYSPGSHQLVAVTGEDIETQPLKLIPDLQIVNVRQHTGDHNRDYGNLEVTVKNEGTGPTWIYDLSYLDAPNELANRVKSASPSAGIHLYYPTIPEDTILGPGKSQTYIGLVPPNIFPDPKYCQNYSQKIRLILSSGDHRKHIFEYTIKASDGALGINPGALSSKYSCKNISVK